MAIHTENPQENLPAGKKMNGWLALSPLLVFLLVYLEIGRAAGRERV